MEQNQEHSTEKGRQEDQSREENSSKGPQAIYSAQENAQLGKEEERYEDIILHVPYSPSRDRKSIPAGDENRVPYSPTCPYAGLESLLEGSRTLYCVLVKFLPTALIADYKGRKFLLDWISKTVRSRNDGDGIHVTAKDVSGFRLCCAKVTTNEEESSFVIEFYNEVVASSIINNCHYKVLQWIDGTYYVPGFERDEIWLMQEFGRSIRTPDPEQNTEKDTAGPQVQKQNEAEAEKETEADKF